MVGRRRALSGSMWINLNFTSHVRRPVSLPTRGALRPPRPAPPPTGCLDCPDWARCEARFEPRVVAIPISRLSPLLSTSYFSAGAARRITMRGVAGPGGADQPRLGEANQLRAWLGLGRDNQKTRRPDVEKNDNIETSRRMRVEVTSGAKSECVHREDEGSTPRAGSVLPPLRRGVARLRPRPRGRDAGDGEIGCRRQAART